MIKHALYILAACTMLTACSQKQEPEATTAEATTSDSKPVAAAKAWLAMTDAGAYTESWSDTSEYFQGVVTAQQLNQSLSAVRTPMGELVSRVTISEEAMTSLPGAPDDDYVVIQFKTEFTSKKVAIETVTVAMDKEWKVAGYYIK